MNQINLNEEDVKSIYLLALKVPAVRCSLHLFLSSLKGHYFQYARENLSLLKGSLWTLEDFRILTRSQIGLLLSQVEHFYDLSFNLESKADRFIREVRLSLK